MFPVSDYNFVFCSIATVAATVGYAFTRKPGSELPSPLARSSEETVLNSPTIKSNPQQELAALAGASGMSSSAARRDSLKRKVPHDGFDEPTADLGYPFNLNNIYPNKRCKTPPSKSDVKESTNDIPVQTTHPLVEQAVEIHSAEGSNSILANEAIPSIAYTSAPEPPRTPSPAPAANQILQTETQPVERVTTVPIPITRPSTPIAFTPRFGSSSTSASQGFAAFAGSTSPFASVKSLSLPSSSFQSSSWSVDANVFGSQNSLLANSENALSPAFGERTEESEEENAKKHAIDAATLSKPQASFTHVTGEEDEDIEQDLKGVKLFVKRGNKPFASGMVGQLKLLSDRKTLSERLLFRREPLRQVSMNVKMNSTVRCTYEAEENAIRLVLKEPISREAFSPSSQSQKGTPLELVVYALKPGRACSKQDFKEFAESLLKNAQLQKTEETTASST